MVNFPVNLKKDVHTQLGELKSDCKNARATYQSRAVIDSTGTSLIWLSSLAKDAHEYALAMVSIVVVARSGLPAVSLGSAIGTAMARPAVAIAALALAIVSPARTECDGEEGPDEETDMYAKTGEGSNATYRFSFDAATSQVGNAVSKLMVTFPSGGSLTNTGFFQGGHTPLATWSSVGEVGRVRLAHSAKPRRWQLRFRPRCL